MKKVNWLLALVMLLIAGGCASILPTTAIQTQIQDSSSRNITSVKGFMSEDGANALIRNTARADQEMRLGEAQAEVIKSQAELNRTMGRIIEKNHVYLWYGFGLGMYGVTSQWPEFQEHIYYPEALIDWQNQTAPQRRNKK